MRLTRADRSVLSDWWFTVDRLMFFGLLLLMGAAWPSVFTVIAALSLPAPFMWAYAAARPAWLAGHGAAATYLGWALAAAIVSIFLEAAWLSSHWN